MSQIVSSQTIVKPMVKIRRERSLPYGGEIAVRIGQQVTPLQVVVRGASPQGVYIIPAAEMLGVPADDLPKYMVAEEGAAVTRGMALAMRSRMLNKKRVIAPVDGVLYSINHGCLILQQPSETIDVRAMLHGYVTQMVSNRGVIIETTGSLVQVMWSSGHEGFGRLRTVVPEPGDFLRPEHVTMEARGSILVGGRLEDSSILEKAGENLVRGFIVGSVPAGIVSVLERFSIPVFVTEGFGDRPMSDPIFELLRQSEGREACLIDSSGGDRDHGRPEIVIPLPANSNVPVPGRSVQTLAVGQIVRILRAPHAGRVGRVVAVHNRSRTLPIGMRIPGVDVALPGGEIVFVPYLNLDLVG